MDGCGATKSTRHAAAEWHLAKNLVGSQWHDADSAAAAAAVQLLAKFSKKYHVTKWVAGWACSCLRAGPRKTPTSNVVTLQGVLSLKKPPFRSIEIRSPRVMKFCTGKSAEMSIPHSRQRITRPSERPDYLAALPLLA